VIPTVPLPCPIQVAPVTADAAWGAAATEATAHLSAARAADTDCQSILLEVRGGGAVLRVVTSDGRSAVRPVAVPADVGPVLEALVTTVPATESGATALSMPPDAAPAAAAPEARDASARANASRGSWWFVGLSGVGRLGVGGWVGASPTARLAAGALLGSWEAGIAGSYDFTTARLTGSRSGSLALSAAGVGAFVGVRPKIGRVAIAVGGEGGATFVNESFTTPSTLEQGMGTGQSQDVVVPGSTVRSRPVEVELGAYLAVVVPVGRVLRVRPQLGFEVVAARMGSNATSSSEGSLPSLPNWDTSFSLGLEGSGP
jgi:hypothetical protein